MKHTKRIFMNLSINTIVKLKVTGSKPFNKTEKKPSGTKLQARYTREEGGLSQFEIKVFELNEQRAKALKGKSVQLNNCSVFKPDQPYASSYWSTTSAPIEIKESISKPVVNTVITGKVEAIEPFSGEKLSGYTLFFIGVEDEGETIYNVKITGLDETSAKALLLKAVKIEQCKPLSRTSYITEEKPLLVQTAAHKE
jgi:hypothetical protein